MNQRNRRPNQRDKYFFLNDTATTEIYTLPLHDALPILSRRGHREGAAPGEARLPRAVHRRALFGRSEEHTSELPSHVNLVCRLLLEKKTDEVAPGPPRGVDPASGSEGGARRAT